MGYIGKFSNLFFSHNIVLLLGHVLAGISFYLVAHILNVKILMLYYLVLYLIESFFIPKRICTYNIDLCIFSPSCYFILDQTLENQIQIKSKKFIFFVLISFLIGCFNPYYTFMYCTFLLFVFIYNFLKKKIIFIFQFSIFLPQV